MLIPVTSQPNRFPSRTGLAEKVAYTEEQENMKSSTTVRQHTVIGNIIRVTSANSRKVSGIETGGDTTEGENLMRNTDAR